MIGWRVGLLCGVIFCVSAATLLAPYDPLAMFGANQPPNLTHPFGTDYLGRDVLSRFLWGGQKTLAVAITATLSSGGLGVALGLIAGGIKGLPARLSLFAIDTLWGIPSMLTALVILTLMGAGFWPLTLAVAIPQVAPIARITYQATRTAYILPYIEAARGLGATPLGILWRHITRAVAPAVIAYIGVVFGYTLLLGSGLAFLGLGWPLGTPEWGIMLAEGRVGFRTAPWVSLPPGIAITGLIWLVNDTCQRFAQGL